MPSVKFLNLNFIPRRDGLVINQLSYVRLFLSSRGPRQETLENDFYARLTIFLNHTFSPKFKFSLPSLSKIGRPILRTMIDPRVRRTLSSPASELKIWLIWSAPVLLMHQIGSNPVLLKVFIFKNLWKLKTRISSMSQIEIRNRIIVSFGSSFRMDRF